MDGPGARMIDDSPWSGRSGVPRYARGRLHALDRHWRRVWSSAWMPTSHLHLPHRCWSTACWWWVRIGRVGAAYNRLRLQEIGVVLDAAMGCRRYFLLDDAMMVRVFGLVERRHRP